MRMSNLRLSSTARCDCNDEDEEGDEEDDDDDKEEFHDIVDEDYDHQGGKCGGQ